MALIKTDNQNYTNIANAIRGLNGRTDQYKPEEMAEAILDCGCGVSYNSSGSEATTYGYKVMGLAGNTALRTVNFSSRATEIGTYAFDHAGITTLVLPEGMKKIGDRAFSDCKNLTSITLPDTLEEIGNRAFYYCEKLSSINLPANLKTISQYAFQSCLQLPITSIPEGVTTIEDGTFYNCEFMEGNFTIHKNVKKIGKNAFYDCLIDTFTFEGIPDEIDERAFYGLFRDDPTFNVPWAEGEVAGAPWGATYATINYNYAG